MDPLARLFARYRDEGDLAALAEVFDRLAPRLMSVALHVCRHPADAEDALQHTFLLAIARAGTFDAARPLEPWLAGLLTNVARSARRSDTRRRTEALPDDLPTRHEGPAAAAERAELVARLRTQVGLLPKEQRQVVMLQLRHGLAPAEIAEVLEVPPGTVRMRLHRGLRTLRRLLPAGLTVWLLGALSPRGIAAVRQVVLRGAAARTKAAALGGAATVTTTLIGGSLAMKKILSVFAIVCLGGLGCLVWGGAALGSLPRAGEPGLSTPSPAAVAAGKHQQAEAPAAAEERVRSVARAPLAEPTGSMRIGVRSLTPAQLVAAQREGTSRFAQGTPIPDCVLYAWAGDATHAPFAGRLELRTDAAGQALLADLASGPWQVLVAADPDAKAQPVQVEPGASSSIELLRQAGGIARGRVIDADGRPVAGAVIRLMRRGGLGVYGRDQVIEPADLRLRRAGTSDADGFFSAAYGADETSIAAGKPGHAASRSQSVQGQGPGREEIRLELGRDRGTVSGTVVDEDGRPVPGAMVVATPAGQDHRRSADGRILGPRLPELTRTDHAGAFAFADLPPGPLHLVVQASAASHMPGMVMRQLEVRADAHVRLELRMEAGVTVFGSVRRADGSPVPARVRARPDRQTNGHFFDHGTRADGTYLLQWVPRRPFVVVVVGPYGKELAFRDFPSPDAGIFRCDFVLPDPVPGSRLCVRVVDERGVALPGWNVRARDEGEGSTTRHGVTRADGRLELVVAPGSGPFLVTAAPPGQDPERPPVHRPGVTADSGPCELRVPDEKLPNGTITGRLSGSDGAAVADCTLTLRGAGKERDAQVIELSTRSAADGAFGFAGLSACEYALCLAAAPGQTERKLTRLDLGHGQALALGTLVVPARIVLRVAFTRLDGSPWSGALPWLQVFAAAELFDAAEPRAAEQRIEVAPESLPDGSLRLQLEPGTYRIRPGGVDLLVDAQRVELAPHQPPATLRFPVGIGRTRTLVFNGDGAHKIERNTLLEVEVRDGNGGLIVRQGTRELMPDLRGFRYWFVKRTFPFGRYEVTAKAASGQRYRGSFEVREALADPTRIDVPLAR